MTTTWRVVEEIEPGAIPEHKRTRGRVEVRIKGEWVKMAGKYASREEAAAVIGGQVADMLLMFQAVTVQPVEQFKE